MNKKGLKVLEYHKIIEMVRAEAGSSMAKDRISKLIPSSEIRTVRAGLAETTEAVTAIVKKGAMPLRQIYDIENYLHLARKGGSLTMAQLLQILYNLKVTSNVTAFVKSDLPQLPIIMAMTEVLVTFPRLAENIDRCILSEDEIAENVPNFSIMTNSVANNGNPFGSADYAKNRNKILNTGIDIWEYEGGYSYH